MKQDNIILTKSFDFAVRIVRLYKYLCDEQKEYVISKQLLRSGTSIGANINEAQAGQSKKDFIAKVSIASKEARENTQPMGVATYKTSTTLPQDYVEYLPSSREIEESLLKFLEVENVK